MSTRRMTTRDMVCFGPAWPCKTERSAREAASSELRSRGFKYDRGSKSWARDSGYGLINFTQRWLRLCCLGESIMITSTRPPLRRLDQAFIVRDQDTSGRPT